MNIQSTRSCGIHRRGVKIQSFYLPSRLPCKKQKSSISAAHIQQVAAAQWSTGQVPAFGIGGGAQGWKQRQDPSTQIGSRGLLCSMAGVLVSIDETTQCFAQVSS